MPMASPKPLSRAEVADLIDSIRSMLAEVDAGDITMAPMTRHRWEGTLTGLEISLGRQPSIVPEGFLDDLL